MTDSPDSVRNLMIDNGIDVSNMSPLERMRATAAQIEQTNREEAVRKADRYSGSCKGLEPTPLAEKIFLRALGGVFAAIIATVVYQVGRVAWNYDYHKSFGRLTNAQFNVVIKDKTSDQAADFIERKILNPNGQRISITSSLRRADQIAFYHMPLFLKPDQLIADFKSIATDSQAKPEDGIVLKSFTRDYSRPYVGKTTSTTGSYDILIPASVRDFQVSREFYTCTQAYPAYTVSSAILALWQISEDNKSVELKGISNLLNTDKGFYRGFEKNHWLKLCKNAMEPKA
jgi:hypothetical protein